MKRSPLKRRGKERSWEDRSGRRLYVEVSHKCERCGKIARLDPEHVAGRGWNGADDWRNLLRVCRSCHKILDQSRGGRIESLYVKMQTDPEHFSLGWFDDRVGFRLTGKLENWLESAETSERHKQMIRELLRLPANSRDGSDSD